MRRRGRDTFLAGSVVGTQSVLTRMFADVRRLVRPQRDEYVDCWWCPVTQTVEVVPRGARGVVPLFVLQLVATDGYSFTFQRVRK